jgi:hypothetical protein
MSASNAFENALALLIFNNTNAANIGDATGLRGSSTAGTFYVSLHTADPGEAGSQTSNETSYTNYARVAVARTSAGWTVSGSNISNTSTVSFPTGGASGATITHFGIGTDSSGSGNLLFSGSLTASLSVSNGVTPAFSAGQLDVDVD